MSGQSEAMRRAEAWVDAWNRGDLEAVLAPIAEEATFTSPLAARLTGSPRIEGKAALRRYWAHALSGAGPPDLSVEQAVWHGQSRTLLILYVSRYDGRERRCCELMRFDRAGWQIHGEAYHGAEEPCL